MDYRIELKGSGDPEDVKEAFENLVRALRTVEAAPEGMLFTDVGAISEYAHPASLVEDLEPYGYDEADPDAIPTSLP